jgi:hypothetical protein
MHDTCRVGRQVGRANIEHALRSASLDATSLSRLVARLLRAVQHGALNPTGDLPMEMMPGGAHALPGVDRSPFPGSALHVEKGPLLGSASPGQLVDKIS